jgi:sugar O-acyltransferase (sialic acid O-acetyltransferase NeuD family)
VTKSIWIIGAGGHARSCIDVIERGREFTVAGLIGLVEEVGSDCSGYRVVGSDSDMQRLFPAGAQAFVGIGQVRSAEPRRRAFNRGLELGCCFPAIVSPHAYVSPRATLGVGTIVMHGAAVNTAVSVGVNCIVNSRALIEHDATIGDHCHVSTGAILNGGVRVGSGTFVGSGVVVREGVVIGDSCFIGMGEIVTQDCPSGTRRVSGKP